MTVLAADSERVQKVPGITSLPLAASTQVFKGSGLMVLFGTGNVIPAADTALGKTVGVAQLGVNNSSGSAGDKVVKVEWGECWQFACTSAAQTWVGKDVYWLDDNTVALLASVTNAVYAGRVVKYISSTLVEVYIPAAGHSIISAQPYGITLTDLRDVAGLALVVSEVAGSFNINFGTNLMSLIGEVANNETEVSVAWGTFIIPDNYVPGGAITLRARTTVSGAGTSNVSTIDCEVYKQEDGAVGSDLNETAAQEITEDAWGNFDYVVTATGLKAGMKLTYKLIGTAIESATDVLNIYIDRLEFRCDVVKG